MGKHLKVVCILLVLFSVPVLAANKEPEETKDEPRLLLVELMTASENSASDEFIELFNDSQQLISTTGLKLQYMPAAGGEWSTKAALEGELQPRGRYLVATKGLSQVEHADTLRSSLGLANSGGHLRLVRDTDSEEYEFDQIAWGDAQFALTSPMPSPEKGKSMKRILDEDGFFVDTDNDNADFLPSDSPTPQRSEPLPTTEDGGSAGNEQNANTARDYTATRAATNTDSKRSRSGPFSAIQITELMPDPDKPLTDAEDEYVELFNPHDEAIDLEEYVIETGMKYNYRFTLPNITLKAGEYIALFSLDTNLTLSNSESQARLLAPNGDTLFEVPPYIDSEPNVAWTLIGDRWQWSAQPTPGAANVAASSMEDEAQNTQNANGSAISRNNAYGNINGRTVYEEPPATVSDEMDTAVVAGVGSLALLYAGYEYRYDIGNRVAQLRRYVASRRGGGEAS